jgi:capsular polysaccharide biosynthesis protein
MPNDPTTRWHQSGTSTSFRQKSQEAVRAQIFRQLFSPASVNDLAPGTPVVELTDGDPWHDSDLRDLPLEPESVSVRSVSTATRPMRAWFLSDTLVAPADGVGLAGRWRNTVAESLNTGPESLNMGQEQTLRLVRRLGQPRPSSLSGTSTLLFSPNRNYYHSLVDNLARLCGLGLPSLASTQVKAVYHEPLTAVERYVLDRIRPPNVSLEPLASQALVRAETFVLPTYPAWRYSGWLPRWYLDQLRTALLPDRPSRRSERLYIVRRGHRRVTNEEDLLRTLGRHGFRPVQLEMLPFPEQVELFHDAEAVVAAHGAGLTNLLFADKALVVELSPTRLVFPHYVLMSNSLGHHHRFVLGTRATRWEEFETDPAKVEEEVMAGLEVVGGPSEIGR